MNRINLRTVVSFIRFSYPVQCNSYSYAGTIGLFTFISVVVIRFNTTLFVTKWLHTVCLAQLKCLKAPRSQINL